VLARQADLEFLSEADELLGSSLDYQSTLGRLTRLLVRARRLLRRSYRGLYGRRASDRPRGSGKVPLVREVLRMFPYPDGLHTHAEVVRTGKSLLVEAPPPGLFESSAVA